MASRRFGYLTSPTTKAEDEARALAEDFNKSPPKNMSKNTLVKAMTMGEAGGEEESDQQMWIELEKLKAAEDLPVRTAEELDIAKEEMIVAWKELVGAFPPEDKPIKRSRNPKEAIAKIFGRHIPDAADQENESMMTSFKTTLQDFCKTLDDFSGVLQFFPSDDKYVKIVTGVLTTVVQATVTYKKIDEGFTSGLEKIRIEFQYCMRVQTQAARDKDFRKLKEIGVITARFFTEVFKFLVPYVRWCQSRFERTKDSLNKNYYDEFVKGPLNDIAEQTRKLEREVNLQAAEDIKDLKDQFTKFERKFGQRLAILSNSEDHPRRMDKSMGEALQLLLAAGQHGTDLNMETAFRTMIKTLMLESFQDPEYIQSIKSIQSNIQASLDHKESGLHASSQGAIQPQPQSADQVTDATELPWKAVEHASDHLEMFSEENGYPLDVIEAKQQLQGRPQIFARLMDWTTASESQTLWLCGPIFNEGLSEISLAAAYMVLLAEQAEVPLIAYRCRAEELGLADSTSGARHASLAMDRLVLMVYSLLRQLVWLLPDTIKTKNDFSAERFAALDASSETLLDALNLLEELLSLAPKVLICVLDGVQLVDNDSDIIDGTGGYLEVLFNILRNARTGRVLKVLFASNGRCVTLDDESNVQLEEQLHVMSDATEQRPLEELKLFYESVS